ncbi:MAG: hypothetical protein MUF07_07720 [Steroidobacteraceae bacterium]|jgi:hypothetical protein|nr:hypothetical protein [Steroidobacteraceae bacterium]
MTRKDFFLAAAAMTVAPGSASTSATAVPAGAILRVSRGRFDPARFTEVDAMIRRTGDYLVPAIRRLPGLIAYFAATAPDGITTQVSVWESAEAGADHPAVGAQPRAGEEASDAPATADHAPGRLARGEPHAATEGRRRCAPADRHHRRHACRYLIEGARAAPALLLDGHPVPRPDDTWRAADRASSRRPGLAALAPVRHDRWSPATRRRGAAGEA